MKVTRPEVPPGTHCGLIAEDNREIAEVLAALLRSIGHVPWIVSNLDELRQAIEIGGFCYVLLDMEMPAAEGEPALASSGETGLRWIRKRHPGMTARGRHIVPVIIASVLARNAAFMSRMMLLDANGFVEKPFSRDMHEVKEIVLALLDRAERAEHEQCVGGGAAKLDGDGEGKATATPAKARARKKPASAAETGPRGGRPPKGEPSAVKGAPEAVELHFNGAMVDDSSVVIVNGKPCPVQPATFVPLVRLAIALQKRPGHPVEGRSVGVLAHTPARIRTALKPGLPKDVNIVIGTGDGRFYLHANTRVRIDWEPYEEHPNAEVRKLAGEQRGRGSGGRG